MIHLDLGCTAALSVNPQEACTHLLRPIKLSNSDAVRKRLKTLPAEAEKAERVREKGKNRKRDDKDEDIKAGHIVPI
ncbi:uncharacterized [Tachysurus ichikawai]